jgi:hypothetical protein
MLLAPTAGPAATHERLDLVRARYEWHLHHTAQAERLRRTLEERIARNQPHATPACNTLDGSQDEPGGHYAVVQAV